MDSSETDAASATDLLSCGQRKKVVGAGYRRSLY